MTVRVLVVDGHTALRGLLAEFLDGDPEIDVVGQAGSVAEAIRLTGLTMPDVVFVNLLEPELLDGPAAVRAVREAMPDLEVVVLASVLAEDSLAAAVEADAIGFVLRDMAPGAIRAQVRAASERRVRVPSIVLEQRRLAPRGLVDPLTPRETQVLQLLAGGRANKEIASALDVSEKTVKSHVSAILAKLEVGSRVQAALYAHAHGLAASESAG